MTIWVDCVLEYAKVEQAEFLHFCCAQSLHLLLFDSILQYNANETNLHGKNISIEIKQN